MGIDTKQTLSNKVYLESNNHGEYVEVKDKRARSLTASIGKIEGLYQLEDKSFVLYVGNNKYLAVDHIDVSLTDNKAIDSIAEQYNLPKEIVEKIKMESVRAISAKNDKAVAAIIVPKISYNKLDQTSYYTYNGYNMKDYV